MPSATRLNSKVDIDASATGFQSAIPSSMRILCIAAQLGVLAAASMHVSQAPILASVAIFGALVSFATLGSTQQLALCSIKLRKVSRDENTGARTDDDAAPMTAASRGTSGRQGAAFPALSGLTRLPSGPFCDIAPANDAVAWAGLCARLSHELRTPLNAVLGFSELMKEELHGPLGRPRYREYVSHIRESGQALLKSTEDTLAITAVLSNSRNQNATTLRGLAVEPLLTDAWHFVEPSARARSVHLKLDVQPDLEVLADQRALRQALINLLEEAICHAADGGCLTVTATSERGLVELEIWSGVCRTPRLDDTLPVTLAKALLEYSGCKLQIRSAGGRWCARASLDRATQPDFFEEFAQIRSATA